MPAANKAQVAAVAVVPAKVMAMTAMPDKYEVA
jgi:hypothetical protein